MHAETSDWSRQLFPPILMDSPHVQVKPDIEPSPEYLPVRKNSENASLLSVDYTDSNTARNLSSMPVPTVPRRAGPQRVEEATATPATISIVDGFEKKAVKESEKAAIEAPALARGRSVSIECGGESKEQEFTHDVQSPPLATIRASDDLKQERECEHEHVDIDYSDELEHLTIPIHAAEHHEHQHLQHADDHRIDIDVDTKPQPSSTLGTIGTAEHDDEDAAEEARRKRVAERLAKMGGVNPFAAPPLSSALRRSSEDTGRVSLPVPTGVSPPGVVLPASPTRPDLPSRKASLRSSHEVVEPHTLLLSNPKLKDKEKRNIQMKLKITSIQPPLILSCHHVSRTTTHFNPSSRIFTATIQFNFDPLPYT